MASKVKKLECDKVNKKRYIAESEVCAKNISVLSNNDIKIVLSKYSDLSLEEKNIVRQFCNRLENENFNRFRNLIKFFREAFDSDRQFVNSRSNPIVNNEKNELKQANVLTTTSYNSEQNIVTNKSSTDNYSVASIADQESIIPSFHTNIISRANNNNNNNIFANTNPFNATIQQRVLNQCISSLLLPQLVVNNTINNLTAVLNLAQNINTTSVSANYQNAYYVSQKEYIENPPVNFEPKTSDRQTDIPQNCDGKKSKKPKKQKKSKKSKNPNPLKITIKPSRLTVTKQKEKEMLNKLQNIKEIQIQDHGKNSIKPAENNLENNVKINIKNESKIENIPKNEPALKLNNTIKIEPQSPSINIIKKEPKSPSIDIPKKEPQSPSIDLPKKEPKSPSIDIPKKEPKSPSIDKPKKEPQPPSIHKPQKEPERVPDLESFSIEHKKKIENFAQLNAIKINLSSNSQMKISDSYSKIKQHTDSKIINLDNIKPFFDNSETNLKTEHKDTKVAKMIKTSYDKADTRLSEYSTDQLKNDQKINNSNSKEKCGLYSNDQRKNVPSNSNFLDECNFLKSIISKNSNETKQSSKTLEKEQLIIIKKAKRKLNKQKKKERKLLELRKLENEKNNINPPKDKPINSNEKTVPDENMVQVKVNEKRAQKREIKVVKRVLRNDNPNDQIIKSISEKPFTEECNKLTENTVLVTKENVKRTLEKTMDTDDLMVLLKYFYKLNGVEQRRLIEFLKELELTEPERVADLRKHVRTNPPDDEDTIIQKNPQPDITSEQTELDDRPASRDSDLSNIDFILEDIDAILNDEDEEESLNNKEENSEPEPKRLKIDPKANKVMETNNSECTTGFPYGKTIPVQFRNSQNRPFNCNQNLNDQSNNTNLMQYNNLIQENFNYNAQNQNNGLSYENQHFQNNLQQAYQLNAAQLLIQNQNMQNQQNYLEFQNFCYNFNNPFEQYQQNYLNFQNGGYFQ